MKIIKKNKILKFALNQLFLTIKKLNKKLLMIKINT